MSAGLVLERYKNAERETSETALRGCHSNHGIIRKWYEAMRSPPNYETRQLEGENKWPDQLLATGLARILNVNIKHIQVDDGLCKSDPLEMCIAEKKNARQSCSTTTSGQTARGRTTIIAPAAVSE